MEEPPMSFLKKEHTAPAAEYSDMAADVDAVMK